MAERIALGLRANAPQFALLVGVNALVGAMVGVERAVLPGIAESDFGVEAKLAVLSFIAAFGVAKAIANLLAGHAAGRLGRKTLLVAGWLLVVPVAPLVALASEWWVVVVANLFLGAGQGIAWSMTIVMKIDLVGRSRRGLALGLNESAGYLGVAIAAFATGALAATVAPRTVVWAGAAAVAAAGLALTLLFVRDTSDHVALETASLPGIAGPRRSLAVYAQAGFVNNLNDAIAWGLLPLFLVAGGLGPREIGAVAAAYPAVWAVGQVGTGWLSDRTGRRPLIVAGMLVQGAALALFAAGGSLSRALVAATVLGLGTALVYPTLLAAVADLSAPADRARAVGVYRFWRDVGFVAGAVVGGLAADVFGLGTALVLTAVLTAASGLAVAAASPEPIGDIDTFVLRR